MIYKQNFPKTPPYLGMNLSVRGRRIFRNRSKSKLEREKAEKEKIIMKLRKQDLIKTDFDKVSVLGKILPKIIPAGTYSGPIIEDFMEEINKTVNKDSGVNFVPATKQETPEKKRADSKNKRVSKYCSAKYKTNKSSLYRRQNVKENSVRSKTPSGRSLSSSRYIGVFRDWAIVNKITSEKSKTGCENISNGWETKTASILKGTNILNGSSRKPHDEIDSNKYYYNNQDAFNLNKLLPHLNACLHN